MTEQDQQTEVSASACSKCGKGWMITAIVFISISITLGATLAVLLRVLPENAVEEYVDFVCSEDTDCAGELVCEQGECVENMEEDVEEEAMVPVIDPSQSNVFVFDGVFGDHLDSEDFVLKIPDEFNRNVQFSGGIFGPTASVWNYEESAALVSDDEYRITFEYSDSNDMPLIFQTDFDEFEEVEFLDQPALHAISTVDRPGPFRLTEGYFFEEIGLVITIGSGGELGLQAAKDLLDGLTWK